MKRFDFPLEKVRRWRHEQAEVEEVRLQKLFAELRAIEAERQLMEAERTTAEAAVRALPDFAPQDFVNLETFRHYVKDRLRQIDQKRVHQQTKVDQQRKILLEAQRQFELLDTLRQKALVEWKAAESKEQEELAAELYLAKRQREIRS